MIEISKSTILTRVAALSAAEHYWSMPGSAEEAAAVHRAPLFLASREGVVSLWIEDACCAMISRLAGWSLQAVCESGTLQVILRGRYVHLEGRLLPIMLRLLTLDVWRRVAAAAAPEAARRAEAAMMAAEDELLTSLLD